MEKLKYLILILILVGCVKEERSFYDYDIEERIKNLNVNLPEPGEPVANYVPTVRFSEGSSSYLVYVSGTGPRLENGGYVSGRLGKDMTIEEGYEAAKLVGINILASLKKEIGDLNKVKRFVKVIGMVNSTPDFYQQPALINGFSDFIVDVFGERGKHARSAVGMVSLPSNIFNSVVFPDPFFPTKPIRIPVLIEVLTLENKGSPS